MEKYNLWFHVSDFTFEITAFQVLPTDPINKKILVGKAYDKTILEKFSETVKFQFPLFFEDVSTIFDEFYEQFKSVEFETEERYINLKCNSTKMTI